MAFPYTPLQQKTLVAGGHQLVLGAAGSGKTMLIIDKTASLLTSGIAPQNIGVMVFAYRGVERLKTLAVQRYPSLQDAFARVQFGTPRDFAAAALVKTGQIKHFISNNQVRSYLRFVCATTSFAGTLTEAEHIIRSLKSRAKKVPDTHPHYALYHAYQTLLSAKNQADRHDIIRAHVIGLGPQAAPALPASPLSHMLVDNAHDATELQTIWLKRHAPTASLFLTANDDLTAFTHDGALGPEAIRQLQSIDGLVTTTLDQHFITPKGLDAALAKVPRMLKDRLHKPATAQNMAEGKLSVLQFDTAPAEHQWLAAQVQRYAAARKRVGVLTRTHTHAALISHVLRKYAGLNPASYARALWDEPTPQTLLALAHVLAGTATPAHIKLMMLGFGLPLVHIDAWLNNGLEAATWLTHGCPLSAPAEASPTTLANLAAMRQVLQASYALMHTTSEAPLDPRQGFMAALNTMLPHINPAEHTLALIAADVLLHAGASQKLADVLPRLVQETLPDAGAAITVAPVTEARNMQFDVVFMPYFQTEVWPLPPFKVLGADAEHERRLLTLALTRSAGTIYLSHHAALSVFGAELQQNLKLAR